MGRRVLVVDDEPYLLRILSFKLRRAGFSTCEATSAEEAQELLRTQTVDLVLLDVALATPTNGFQLAEWLKSQPDIADVPVIMLTARGFAQDIRRGHEVGAAGYITKPFSTAEVVQRVEAILAE